MVSVINFNFYGVFLLLFFVLVVIVIVIIRLYIFFLRLWVGYYSSVCWNVELIVWFVV